MIVRIVIWSLFDSMTTIEELRERLPALEEPSTWIWNAAIERFGLVAFGDELPEGLAEASGILGREPDIYEEFDELEL